MGRSYLEEAFKIAEDKSKMKPRKEHVRALHRRLVDTTDQVIKMTKISHRIVQKYEVLKEELNQLKKEKTNEVSSDFNPSCP